MTRIDAIQAAKELVRKTGKTYRVWEFPEGDFEILESGKMYIEACVSDEIRHTIAFLDHVEVTHLR